MLVHQRVRFGTLTVGELETLSMGNWAYGATSTATVPDVPRNFLESAPAHLGTR